MRKITKLMLALALCVAGVGSAKAGNHYLEITTNAVKANAWEWAIWYQLATPLETGKTYVLTMDAKCSEAYNIPFWPCNTNEGGKTKYTGYNIGTEWSTCVCEFEANDDLNRLVWDFGSLNGYLRFDNIKLVEKGTTTNLMTGGDFESGLDANWGNDGWNKPEYSIYESENTPARCLKMTTDAVKDNAWEWAIWYKLDSPLEKDKTYVLSMKAKCSEAYNMPFWPYKADGATNYTGYNIGTEWGNCSCTFTAADDLTHLKWCFGSLNGTVWFDDVKLVEQGSTTNLINDGGFDDGLASNWGDDGWNKPQYGVSIEYPAVKAVVPVPEVQLTQSMFKEWDSPNADATITPNNPYWNALNYGAEGGGGSVIYGNGNVAYLNYADLSSYSGMKIYGTGSNLRILMNRVEDNGALTEVVVTPSAEGTFVDFSSYEYVHLNSIKVVNGGGATTITNITLIDPTVTVGFDYALSGDIKDGVMTTSAIDALADESAKAIDVTGVTGKGALASSNPNCLFTANSGALSNANNVIVNGTCANLVLTDGHPFKAPADFTATSATYTTTINTAAKAGTLILPFAATIPEGVKAYTLTYASGDAVTATEQTGTIPASVPVLLNGSGEVTFTGSGTVTNVPTANIASNLVGVYEETTVPLGSYVLQNGDDGVGFYKVTTDDIKANPFRAYLTAQGPAAKVRVIYEADDATAITSLEAQDVINETIYNLNGMRVSHPTKGIYIKNGKKFIVK